MVRYNRDMKRWHFILLVLLATAGIAAYFLFGNEPPFERMQFREGPIVAFGDSLVVGVGAAPGNDFVSLLSARIDEPIINLGRSGDTTEKALARISEVINEKPALVIVLLGGNDYLRKVPIDQTF